MNTIITGLMFAMFVGSTVATQPNFVSQMNFTNTMVGETRYDALTSLMNYCNSYCGGGNCEDWDTGKQAGPSGQSRISCPSGYFCDGGSCYDYAPCMDYNTNGGTFSYGTPTSNQPGKPIVFSVYVDNDTDGEQTGSQQWSKTTSNSYSWTWSASVTVSDSLSVEVGIPGICKMSDTVTTSISASTGGTHTKQVAQTWTLTQNYKIPKKTTYRLDLIVSQQTYSVPYTQSAHIGGTGAIWCRNRVQDHFFWFIPTSYFLPCDGNGQCNFQGTFNGVEGIGAQVEYKKCALYARC
jgi:hypothetical protein